MRRYTTTTQSMTVAGADLTGCDVHVTYRQGSKLLKKRADSTSFDGEVSTVTVGFSQEETAEFKVGSAMVQINWISPEGSRAATSQKPVMVEGNLLEEVISFGE